MSVASVESNKSVAVTNPKILQTHLTLRKKPRILSVTGRPQFTKRNTRKAASEM